MIRPDFVNHRLTGESFEVYRARRRAVARAIKAHLRGRLTWRSTAGASYTTTPYTGGSRRCQRALLREFRPQ